MDDELGHGTVTTYETLMLTDGITVAEVIAQLAKFPASAKIYLDTNSLEDTSINGGLRLPVAVYRGHLVGKEL